MLVCLLIVVGHLIFTNLYLPYHMRQARRRLARSNSRHQREAAFDVCTVAAAVATTPVPQEESVLQQQQQQQQPKNDTKDNCPLSYESRYDTDYEHVRCLGRGAFGVVFEARHRVDQYCYAVKRVRVRYSEQARARLLQEVQGESIIIGAAR